MQAAEKAFGDNIPYAMLVKLFGSDAEGPPNSAQRKYSPDKCTGAGEVAVTGNTDPAHVSIGYVERQNLTMRMSMRRFAVLSDALSKKVANHEATVAVHFTH